MDLALMDNHNSSKGRHHLSSTLLKAHLRDSTRPRDSTRLLPIQLRSIFMPLLVRTARSLRRSCANACRSLA